VIVGEAFKSPHAANIKKAHQSWIPVGLKATTPYFPAVESPPHKAMPCKTASEKEEGGCGDGGGGCGSETLAKILIINGLYL